MMLAGFVGFTAIHGSSSVFTKLISPGIRNPEMSQEANGLFPFAGGLGVPEACRTTVLTRGPADAAANGRRIASAEIATAIRGMRLPMAPSISIGSNRRPILLTH